MKGARATFRAELILLFSLVGVFYINILSRVITAPLMPVIEKEFGVGHSDAGIVFMMLAAGYALGLICSGVVSSRLTHRHTILVSAVAMGILLILIALSDGLWVIRVELLLVGFFSGFYLPSGITTITSAIASSKWGKAISVHETAPNMAFITAPLIAEGLLLFLPWRAIMAAVGILSIVTGIVFVSMTSSGDFKGDPPTFGNFRLVARNHDFWIIAFLFGAAIGVSMGVYNMMPLYLAAERGIDRSTANTLLGLSRISVIPLVFISGWIVDRFGVKLTMAIVMLFNGTALILLGAIPGRWVILMVFLQPMLTGSFFPAGFSAISTIVPERARSLAVSLAIFVAYLVGAGLIPIVLGIFGDAGMFGVAFMGVGSAILISLFFIPRLDAKLDVPKPKHP
jgi:NNP family nitrate/nitrite transporter-like MFS transporter